MSDRLEKPGSALAVVAEKKPQRPGGCVGIFFQLFDWNRRFAKKKLFAKKLLPPDRLKQSSKKFGGDEKKKAKIRLIADENKGGFPGNLASNSSNADSRVPGLVARLMGLETMPTLHRDKSKKASAVDKGEGLVKNELRPPKLQKAQDRRAIARFEGEKLPLAPFKNVLSKTRKHYHHHSNHGNHPKLPTPVKSPRSGSRKGSSRLMGAATRILEPGLQNSRSKNALTYLTPSDCSIRDTSNKLVDCEDVKGQQCQNCGYLLDNSDCTPVKPVVLALPLSHRVGSTCRSPELSEPGCSSSYQELDVKASTGYPAIETNNVRPHIKFTSYKNPLSDQAHPTNLPMNFGSKHKPRSENRTQAPIRKDSGRFEPEGRVANKLNDLGPPGRKRRPTNMSSITSLDDDQTRGSFLQPMRRKHPGCSDVDLINLQCGKKMGENAVTYAYNSPAKMKSGVREVPGKRVKNDLCVYNAREAAMEEHGRRKTQALSSDALGAFLQQKLKELSCQGDETNGNVPRKTTAMILHELVSALSSELPFPPDPFLGPSDRRNSWRRDDSHSSFTTSLNKSQAYATATRLYVDQPHYNNHHPSPGSVLEPESCPSSTSTDNESVLDILNSVSETLLHCSKLANCGLDNGNNLDRAKEVLSAAELALHDVGGSFPVKRLLVDEIEALGNILWMNFGCALGIIDGKDLNHRLTRFAFDVAVEHLGSRFGGYFKPIPSVTNANALIFEIAESVGKWEEMSRWCVDEVVEREMGCSIGEWTECVDEVLEMGVEISRSLWWDLVGEVVTELFDGRRK